MISKGILGALFLVISLSSLNFSFQQDQNLYKIESAPVTLDSPVIDVLWCGVVDQEKEKEIEAYFFDINGIKNQKKSKFVFLQTHKGTIYRSDDEGFTWKNIQKTLSDLRDNIMSQNQDLQVKKIEEQSYIVKMQNSDAESQLIYFKGIQGVSYYTPDCGLTYKAFQHDKNIHEFKLSEQQPGWLLGAAKNQCKEDKCYESYNLHFSNNYGQTWDIILDQIYEYSWGNYGGKLVSNAIPDARIIVTLAKPRQYNSDRQVVFSDDFFKSRSILSYYGHKFFIKMPNIYVLEYNTEAQDDNNSQSQYLLKVSTATAPLYNLKEIKIQIQRIKDHAFTILDSREHTIFININHYGSYAQFGNLYVSDMSGAEFSLSLLHNVRDSTGICDFERVLSLEGVYIANHIENEEADLVLAEADQIQEAEGDSFAKLKNKVTKVKKTVISYDRGSTWHYLKPPQQDSLGKPIQCSGECSLHLKGFTDDAANPIYSAYQAVGLIIAVGNVGLYVSTRPEDINTYFSRDGGHTWAELKKGSHIYEFGDHGGLIILAKDKELTNFIEYSWDEGLTWEKYKFSEQKIVVTNIVTEPSNMDQIFLLYGQTKGSWDGIVYTLNFNNLHQVTCKGGWETDIANSDYEEWIPQWSDKNNCMFGQLFKYIRRKQESKCFNPDDVIQKKFYEVCNCTIDDYTCMSGFERNLKGECVPMNQEVEDRFKKQQLPPDDCYDTYKVPTGYKKIAGDFCVYGETYEEKILSCKEQKEIIQQQAEQIHDKFEKSSQMGEQINKDIVAENNNQQEKQQTSEKQFNPTVIETKSSQQAKLSSSTSKFSQQQSSSQDSSSSNESGGFFKKLIFIALVCGLGYYFRANLQEMLANVMIKIQSFSQEQPSRPQQGGYSYQKPFQGQKDYDDVQKGDGGGSGLLEDDEEN